MGNPYRKLFNLFAFSLLAFAVYINFFRSDNNELPERKIPFGQANISSQQKPLLSAETNKMPLAKVEKKN
jgi:hypothetical protein